MNRIRYLNLNISLFGRNLSTKHLVEVHGDTYIPIGRELSYQLDSLKDKIYVDLPTLSVNNGILDTKDSEKIKKILNEIVSIASGMGLVMYPSYGMNIDIVSESHVIKLNQPNVTLIDGKTPNQDAYRVLIDISDQLLDHSPKIDSVLVFSLESNDNMFVARIPLELYMKYDNEKSIYFYSDQIVISYDILSGLFKYKLAKNLENELLNSHRLNFPFDKNPITVNLLAIETNVNYRSIIFN